MNNEIIIERFINSCSHDLRTPITSIRGLVKLALVTPDPKEVYQCLEQIDMCINTMDSFLQSLAQYMIISSHNPTTQQLNLHRLIETVIAQYSAQIAGGQIQIRKRVTILKSCSVDPYICSILLFHLIGNSVTFYDKKKTKRLIDINVSTENNDTILQVIDNGVGISDQCQQHIFKPFYRANIESRGLGMGLFHVFKAVGNSKSRMAFYSKENVGTSFWICIPNSKNP